MSERLRRVFSASPCAPGARVVLDPDESHHLTRVLRVGLGDTVAIFDGSGGEWSGHVESAKRDAVTVLVGEPIPGSPESPLEIALFQATVRPERIEWVLQKGTEIGVFGFVLAEAERSEAPAPPPARLDRFHRIVLEAAKQSGRRRVPDVAIGRLPHAPEHVTALVLDPSSEASTLASVLRGRKTHQVWIAVGPEGGLTDAELAHASAHGWRRVSLGPRVLRTETAGVVAAAIVQHAWGDLGA